MLLSILSYSTGVPGVIFAPFLTLGVILAVGFGIITKHYFKDLIPNIGIFAIAGMGVVFHAFKQRK